MITLIELLTLFGAIRSVAARAKGSQGLVDIAVRAETDMSIAMIVREQELAQLLRLLFHLCADLCNDIVHPLIEAIL